MEFSSFQNRLEHEESGSGDIDGETGILRVSIYWSLLLINIIKSFTLLIQTVESPFSLTVVQFHSANFAHA